MLRHVLIICLFMTFGTFAGCQSYSTAIVESHNTLSNTVIISTLQQIAKAQLAYSVDNGGNFGTFEQLTVGGHLDSRFASSKPEIQGYAFSMSTSAGSFSCNADPVSAEKMAGPHFYIDSTSPEVHANATAPASASDPKTQ